MTRQKHQIVLTVSGLCVLLWLGIHIKNYFQVGNLFMVIKGDGWDKVFHVLGLPGSIPSVLIAVVFWSVHDYPYYFVVEILPLLFNCAFYSFAVLSIARVLSLRRRMVKSAANQ